MTVNKESSDIACEGRLKEPNQRCRTAWMNRTQYYFHSSFKYTDSLKAALQIFSEQVMDESDTEKALKLEIRLKKLRRGITVVGT